MSLRIGDRRPWQPHELDFLQQWYGVLLVEDLAQLLRRRLPGVRSKILELGLRCRTRWTSELDEFLSLLFPDTAATELGAVMGVTPAAVRRRAEQIGVRKAPEFAAEHSRRTTLARSVFTPEIAEILELLYPDVLTEDLAQLVGIRRDRIHAYANSRGWKKTRDFVAATARARSTPDHPMVKHRFAKGHVPANKGMKGWQAGGRARETQFKKGNRPQTWKPIGSYRINDDGYLDRKVSDTGCPPRDWIGVHRLVWMEAHGPIPPGHVVRFKPGMKTTDPQLITVDRVECISKAENARRNAWHATLPPELRQLKGAQIALSRAINRKQRELEQTP